jgi:hypothetical protein
VYVIALTAKSLFYPVHVNIGIMDDVHRLFPEFFQYRIYPGNRPRRRSLEMIVNIGKGPDISHFKIGEHHRQGLQIAIFWRHNCTPNIACLLFDFLTIAAVQSDNRECADCLSRMLNFVTVPIPHRRDLKDTR